MTAMALCINVITPTSSRVLPICCNSLLHQIVRNTHQRCLSTLQLRKTQCQIPAASGRSCVSRTMTGGAWLTSHKNHISAFYLSLLGFSTSSQRRSNGMTPGEMKRHLQSDSGMYGVNVRGQTFDIRNTSKLVTSFPYLPVYELNRLWLLHLFPRHYLGNIDTGFSASELIEGADMAVEPILEAAGNGNFEELYSFMDEKTIEEMKINRKNVNTELINLLNADVICDMAFRNERTLCSCDIEQLDDRGTSRVSVTGVLRGDAMISTEMGQFLYQAISPTWISKPHEIPMNLNLHFLFRCVREYTDDDPHRDWVINGFTFTLDFGDLFIAYIL